MSIRTMRSSDALSSFSNCASSVLYCSSSGLSGLVVGAGLSFEPLFAGVGTLAVAIFAALGVAISAMLLFERRSQDGPDEDMRELRALCVIGMCPSVCNGTT